MRRATAPGEGARDIRAEIMLTTLLIVISSVLATLAAVLLVALVRVGRRRPASNVQPEQTQPRTASPAVEALARDLQNALARYREPVAQQAAASSPSRPALQLRPAPPPAGEPVTSPPRTASASSASSPRVAVSTPSSQSEPAAGELQELLTQALETARAIPGADAAVVALTAWREPLIGTVGLARQEADRLASTLPVTGAQTRSITIDYEYDDARDEVPAGRIERGIAVPIRGLPTPALIAILTRSPGANLGEPQIALLEQVATRLAPALATVLERETDTPMAITVRERAGPPDASAEREEGQEVRQIDRFRDR